MATLVAKEVGGSDSSNLTSSLPNDTDFGVNWAGWGAHGSPTRDGSEIQSSSNTSSVTLNIGSLSLTDVEIRVTGLDMKGVTSAGEAFYMYLVDATSGSLNGYELRYDPNRATTSQKFWLRRLDAGSGTELDNTVESGWSATSGETLDLYLRFDESTVTARAVQSAQSLDETLSAADTTFNFGTGAGEIDQVYISFRDTLLVAATFEVWDMTASGPTKLLGSATKLLGGSGSLFGI